MTSYTVHIDGINGFYACVIGDPNGAHTSCYETTDALWDAIKYQTDTFLWPQIEETT